MMQMQALFRSADVRDCRAIAELFSMASDGVSNYIWSTLQQDYPGLSLLEIGAKRYSDPEGLFSYRNCVVAEVDGDVVGMMLTFPTEPSQPEAITTELPETDVMSPYSLEAPNTWYICGLAIAPEHRGHGLGTQFLKLSRQQAREHGYDTLSLLCFEQNVGAYRLYTRNGFSVCDRHPVVPHPMIHHTGDILLMTASVQQIPT